MTAADLLADAPDNLTIITNQPVHRLLMNGKTAIGVESNGKQCKYTVPEQPSLVSDDLYIDRASKDIILSAGALDTPKILLLSGIGPAGDLSRHGIKVVQDLPYIGKGLRDHPLVFQLYLRKEGTTDRPAFYGNPETLHEAKSNGSEIKQVLSPSSPTR